MADPTLVNGQITDAITQAGVTGLGIAPAQSLATGFQVGAHATGLAMQNAVANQHHTTTLSGSAATQAVSQVLTLPPSQTARATVETLTRHALASELVSLSAAIRARRNANVSATANGNGDGTVTTLATPSPHSFALAAAPPDVGAPDGDASPPDLAAQVAALTDGMKQLADAIKALARTPTGEHRMNDQEALDAIRRAADRLNTLLEDLAKHMAAGPPAELWTRLSEALEELRRATRLLEERGRPGWCQPAQPQVPVGATPPNVFIVGSGNAHSAAPRVVGASW